jgi:inhibitor of KinA sporulation pathway (predicted exonuclease)
MAKRLDKIIVIDVEATCWEGEPPPGQSSEIIEIGLCELDVDTGKRAEPRAILVRPQRSTLSDYCQTLTTLTPKMLADGMPFDAACALLKDTYRTHHRTWASYGDYDRLKFQDQCKAWGLDYPFGRSHINVKNLLALQLGLDREVNLQEAARLVGLTFEGTIHRGVDDVWNIAAVLARVLLGRTGQT